MVEKVRMRFDDDDELDREDELADREEDEDEDAPEIEDHYNDPDEPHGWQNSKIW